MLETQQEKLGRYKRIWFVLRERKALTINLQLAPQLSTKQKEATVKTIVKAVSKEKYEDILFRRDNPGCRLKTHLTMSQQGDRLDFWFENIKGTELTELATLDLSTL